MRGLFIHDHKFPKGNGSYYYSYGFDKEFFSRYLSIFDELEVIGRQVEARDATKKDSNIIQSDISFFTFKSLKQLLSKKTRNVFKNKIIQSEYVVIRVPSIFGLYGAFIARKYNKPYIIEVVGCAWDAIIHKGSSKIFAATIITYLTKLIVKKANYVIYVTEEFLERRYPTKGNYIACSNVTLNSVNDADINNRLEMIDKIDLNNKLIFGTCATIDVVYKGQEDVMKVIHKLVKEGYNIEYQLVGGGNKKYLESVARKLGISNRVKFIGTLEHKEVFRWLESIDFYVHPSKQEGLSRAIIEAMSKGCPIFAANAGGIHELIDKEFIFDKGNVNQIYNIFKSFSKYEMSEQAINNYNNSKKYLKPLLYQRRNEFYNKFKNESKNKNGVKI